MSESTHKFHQVAGARFKAALGACVGHKKAYSVDMVSEGTEIPERTIRSYVFDDKTPGLGNLLLLFKFLPLTFTNHILNFVGLHARRISPGEQSEPKFMIEASGVVHRLAEMLADGRIDHQERPVLIALLRSIIESAQALITKLEQEDSP